MCDLVNAPVLVAHAAIRYRWRMRDRRQGRHPEQRDASSPPVAIIEHADVRRMLLAVNLSTEAR